MRCAFSERQPSKEFQDILFSVFFFILKNVGSSLHLSATLVPFDDDNMKVEALQEQGHVEVHSAQDSAIITQFLSWDIVDDVQEM